MSLPRPPSAAARGILQAVLGASWPICVGYLPVGLAFGVLAQKAGLSPARAVLMSVIVFAGGSQFIIVAMLAQGAAALAVAAAVFMVNLRHLLMSSVLSPHLAATGQAFRALYAYGVTDESFAVNLGRFQAGGWSPGQALAVNHLANAVWVASTLAGALAGELVPAGALGIDFALPAMFICLLVSQVKGRAQLLTALTAAALSVTGSLAWRGNSHLIAASAGAAALVAAAKGWMRGRQR